MPVLVDAVWACPDHLRDIPELVAAEDYDAIVVDCLMFAALAAVERLTVPAMVLVHSASGALVPPGDGMEYLALDRVNTLRAEVGLPAVRTLWDTWRPFTTICTSIRELDPLGGDVPATFEYVGPVFEPHPHQLWQPPWPPENHRPLVLASFSTGGAWDQTGRIRRTLEAFADGQHRLLVTTGAADLSGTAIPSSATLAAYIPHGTVLPQVSATITHAGHGTVAASLAHGVPLLCLPNPAADQPALAAQVVRLGAGIALDGETATPADIAHAVATLLTDDTYRDNSARLAAIIGALPGASAAATRLESLALNGPHLGPGMVGRTEPRTPVREPRRAGSPPGELAV